ncbi:hypothetical protein AVEN_85426-1 [Araneus ventricosus]|uniref:RING-type domain-containing protein n=1 Tax=Araneus ventricosus TaxID=182803 RepID=A0A4Y2B6T3_ARAVE|nr:hypothetical protein AVEN_85426-1 [Araneus ventricosus]
MRFLSNRCYHRVTCQEERVPTTGRFDKNGLSPYCYRRKEAIHPKYIRQQDAFPFKSLLSPDEMATPDKVFRCKNSTSDQLEYLDRRMDCGHEFHRKCLFSWGYSGIPCTWDQDGFPHPWDSESIPCPKCLRKDGYGMTL